jgi:Na+-translocating ferredoxin:NAD+ oxidoreductase RnfG subunit
MELLNTCEAQFLIILALLAALVTAVLALVYETKKSEDLKQELDQLRKDKLRKKCCEKEY